jgi:hypothetical protein
MVQQVCEHLRPLEDELAAAKIPVTFAGQAWSSNCRYWIYVDAVLDGDAIRKRLKMPEAVTVHVNDDPRSGREQGLVCGACKDAVVGIHPADGRGKAVIS